MIQRFGTGSYNLRLSEDMPPPAPIQPSCSTSNQPVSILRRRVNFMGIRGANNSFSLSSTVPSNPPTLICTVYFLDDTQRQFEVQKNATGEDLLNQVFSHLELMEKDFFGLQFISLFDLNCARMRWLDANKSIKRQIVCPPYQLYFRVKFYVSDPSRLVEEYTRYLFYLQIRKDLLQGHLSRCCEDGSDNSLEMAAILGSFAVQSEFGDFVAEEHTSMDYLTNFQFLPIQSDAMLHKIARLHQLHVGQTPAEAEFNFLAHAKRLPMYGFDLHEAKDGTNHPITIGVNSSGVSVFENRRMVNAFPWAAITKLSFKRKTFFLRMKTLGQNGVEVDTELSFNAICSQNCKILWKSCIEHHTFFRLIAAPTVPNKSLFNLGSKFRYSGRTEFQTIQQMKQRQQRPHRSSQQVFQRPLCYSSSPNTAPTPSTTTSFMPRPTSSSPSQASGSATPSNSSSCLTDSTKIQSSLAMDHQLDVCSNQLALPMFDSITSATTSGISTSSMAISCTDANELEGFYGLVEYSLEDGTEPMAETLGRKDVSECSGQAKLDALESLLRSVSCSCSRSTSPYMETAGECNATNVEEDTSESEKRDEQWKEHDRHQLQNGATQHLSEPRPVKATHPSTTSCSSTCSCSPAQEHVPTSTNLQRRYSITLGGNHCEPLHSTGLLYDCVEDDDIFSASDTEAALNSSSPSAMSSRARLRRKVELGAALDAPPSPSSEKVAQQRKLTYQDLPLCDSGTRFQLPRPSGNSSSTTPTTSRISNRDSHVTHNGPHNCIPLPTNLKPGVHNNSTPSSMTSKHLRIRQRIPLTNPRMAPSTAIPTVPEVQKQVCGRESSSSSSICSGSTYKTAGTDVENSTGEYGSVGSGNCSSTPSSSNHSNGCQQFPVFTPVNIDHNVKKGLTNSGVTIPGAIGYQHQLKLQVVARGESVGMREASPYDVPGSDSWSSSRSAESNTTYRVLTPILDNVAVNNGQSCSSSITLQPTAGNGSYCAASSVSNQYPYANPNTNNNSNHPIINSSSRPNITTLHSQMPSSTALANNNNSNPTANAEKFLLEQQHKKLNQQQNGSKFSLNLSDRLAPDHYPLKKGAQSAGQSHQILVHPSSSRSGNQVFSSSRESLTKKSVLENKPHHHHHHRQNSHQKRSQKSTEFPVLVNGQLPESNARMDNNTNTDFSSFPPTCPTSQSRLESVKKEASSRISTADSSSSRLSMPVVMTTPKVIKVPSPVVLKLDETNGHKSSTHKLSSARLLDAVNRTSVPKQDSECLPYSALVNGDDTTASVSSSSPSNGGGQIVAVRISTEAQRHFELSVTGGSDLSHPAIISRICLNSNNVGVHPQAIPSIPLNEGDQLLKINGRDVDKWTQAQVQGFLKELKATGSDILLHIKPNVYRCCSVLVDDEDNSPQTHSQNDSAHKKSNGFTAGSTVEAQQQQHVADSVPRSDKLAQSLVLLKEAIESGRVVKQFEQLYRKKPGMGMNDSKLLENAGKNRYRDVCPYDLTRVLLKDSPNGDYINACHVNMEIPASGIVNRYIATQGPLPNTTVDFWHMVWEQSATTIAMLTTLVEKGRVKCHQYWPDQPKETMELGCGSPLQVTNMSERVEAYCHYRELAIRNKITREERLVTQMQYTAWPDHGVPENPQHFIEFVNEVRKARNGSLDPLIVHCSAGIGRTGVLILMETSACQIEANEPVYPLDSMRLMRDQRAMLIQTAEQYTFVCESILRAYNEQSVKPLAEYQKCR